MHSFIRFASATLLMALVSHTGVAQHSTNPAADSVATLIARYDQAWNARDVATVNGLLAPDYQYFSSTGVVSSRGETLQFLGAPEYRLDSARRTELRVSVSGPVAVVSSRWQGRGAYRGAAFVDDQRCSLVWLQAPAGWQLLSEHCTQITPAPAS